MKQLSQFILLIVSLLLVACEREGEIVISERKFEQILFELYQADAIAQVDRSIMGVDDAKKDLLISILNKNSVTLQQYDSTVMWFSQNSDQYYKVYQNLLNRVERIERLNSKEIERIELLALTAKGDSVLLNKEVKSIRLNRSNEEYTLTISKDKHFANLELFRLSFVVPVIVGDTLFARLNYRLLSGNTVEKIDTVIRSGNHTLFLTAKEELSSVTMRIRVKKVGLNNTSLWLSNIQFARVHIDSSRLEKSLMK